MSSRRRSPAGVVSLSLDEVRALPAIPSGYDTDRELRLERTDDPRGITWSLEERLLPHPIHRTYDEGEGATWLDSHADAGPPDGLHFLGVSAGGSIAGLATWTISDWNDSLWLVDLRVREASRRAGLGSSLVDELVTLCGDHQLRGIFVETQTLNYPAVRFYLRRGFRISGFNDHLYSNGDLARQEVGLFLFREVDAPP